MSKAKKTKVVNIQKKVSNEVPENLKDFVNSIHTEETVIVEKETTETVSVDVSEAVEKLQEKFGNKTQTNNQSSEEGNKMNNENTNTVNEEVAAEMEAELKDMMDASRPKLLSWASAITLLISSLINAGLAALIMYFFGTTFLVPFAVLTVITTVMFVYRVWAANKLLDAMGTFDSIYEEAVQATA